jgi:hypothetical protein
MNAGFDGLITVPGYGHVYIGVGRVVVTVDASGNVTEVSSALVTPTTAVSARCCGSRPGRHRLVPRRPAPDSGRSTSARAARMGAWPTV